MTFDPAEHSDLAMRPWLFLGIPGNSRTSQDRRRQIPGFWRLSDGVISLQEQTEGTEKSSQAGSRHCSATSAASCENKIPALSVPFEAKIPKAAPCPSRLPVRKMNRRVLKVRPYGSPPRKGTKGREWALFVAFRASLWRKNESVGGIRLRAGSYNGGEARPAVAPYLQDIARSSTGPTGSEVRDR